MKHIPNILTFSRIILALFLLLFLHQVTTLFIIIFTIAMATDLFDGAIARRLGVCSDRGAFLDRIADFLLDANLIKIVFTMKVMSKTYTLWMLSALCIGTISPIINLIKHKKIFFIHSIPCKLCMWSLFGVPFAIQFGFGTKYIALVLTLISFAMIEIVFMSLMLKEPDPDASCLFSVIKQNKAIKI